MNLLNFGHLFLFFVELESADVDSDTGFVSGSDSDSADWIGLLFWVEMALALGIDLRSLTLLISVKLSL